MNIKIYTLPTCPWCIKTKDFLTKKGVAFQNFDVSTEPQRRDEMIKISGQRSVPVLDIDGKLIIGFDQAAIEKAIAKK